MTSGSTSPPSRPSLSSPPSPSAGLSRYGPAPLGELVWLAVAVAAVSSSATLVRAAEAPALAIAFWRTALGFGLTGAVLAGRRRATELRGLDRATWRRTALAGALLAAHFATWLPSLSFTSVASSVALVCTTPVWTALIARSQGRYVPPAEWWGIGVALIGVVALTGVDLSVSPRALFGDLLALLGGILAALYLVVGAGVRQRLSTAAYTTGCYGVAAVALLVGCGIGRHPVVGFDAGTWLALGAITAGPQLLGHTLLNRVLRTVDATVVAVALLFEIVVSALLAWAFLAEVPPLSAVPAGVLLIAGTLMVIRSGRSSSPAAQVEAPPIVAPGPVGGEPARGQADAAPVARPEPSPPSSSPSSSSPSPSPSPPSPSPSPSSPSPSPSSPSPEEG